MDSRDTVRERFEALAQQTEPFQPQTPPREAPTRRGARQRWGRLPWRVAALMVLGLVLAPPGQGQAKTFHCGAGDVPCLIETINEANANGQANTMRLAPGTYTLTAVAQAQEYTFTTIDLPATGGAPGRIINLVGIANDGTMAGDDNSPNGLGSRISPTLDVTPVTCLPGTFDRYPFASRLGPEVVAMNNALTVVGNDEGLVALHGFQQPLAGDCSFFLFPGAVGTLFTGIDDLGRIVGQYWNDPAVEFGLLRFHAFVKDDDTLTPLTDGITNDVLWPTGINAAGDIIGYAFRDVQPDNSYIYQAFYYSGGIFTWLDGPRGEDVWLTGVNNAGQVTAVLHPQGVVGGPAWLYDHITATWTMLPMPTPDTDTILPRAINDHGALVGFYAEFFPEPPPFGHSAFHQFLATPVPPLVPEPPHKPKKFLRFLKKHRQHIRERLREALQDASAHRWQHPLLARHWWPVLDEDGSVCLTDGVRVIGRRP